MDIRKWKLVVISTHSINDLISHSDFRTTYMLEMIKNCKGSAVLEDRWDLMCNMIRVSMGETALQKDFTFMCCDLLGNIFVFLVVGKVFHFHYSI